MLTIHVCVGSACHVKGAYNIINKLQSLIEEANVGGRVSVKAVLCLGECTQGISVRVNEGEIKSVNEKNIRNFFENTILAELQKGG